MKTVRLVRIAIFVALISVGGLISVPIPFTQVEISFQTMFVITAGLLLGARDGALACLIYVVMGLLGLPVFTQGGGPAYVFKPSFGYLIGFPLGALVAGAVCSHSRPTRGRAFVAALVGMIPIYVLGVMYQELILYYYSGYTLAAVLSGLPAIGVLALKDSVLLGVVSALYPALYKALGLRRKKNTDSNRERSGGVALKEQANK